MSDERYEIPETYEEAVARKKEVLQKINEYNEAVFSETELPYTEEEIDALQEEYEILNDRLKLTEEEKVDMLDEDEVEVKDGVKVKKTTIWDKIHWSVYVYAVISTIFASGIMTKPIGNAMMNGYVNKIFDKAYSSGASYYLPEGMIPKAFKYWFTCIASYVWFPLAIILVSLVVYLIFKKRNDINSKITFWILMLDILLAIIVITILLTTYVVKNWQEIYDNFAYCYYIYVLKNYGSAGYY